MIRYVCCLLLALLTAPPVLAQSAPSGAVCVVKHQDKVLLVQDRVSSRYSLTGGYIDQGETPAQAALRELFEETGLRGRIVAPLGRWRSAELFACQSLSPIRAQSGTGAVSLLQAPNRDGEVLSALLIAPTTLPHALRRFPAQLDWIVPRLASIPDSEVTWVADFRSGANALHDRELTLIRQMQSLIGPKALWLQLANLAGSTPFLLLLIPFLLPLLGWPRVWQLLFAMLWLALLTQLAKEAVAWPRPFNFMPDLAPHAVSGFGMPSGHTATAMLGWGLLLGWAWPKRRGAALTLALLLGSATGLARVWLGVHFISDVVAGLLLGLFLLTLRSRLLPLASHYLAWLLLAGLAGMGAAILQSPTLAAIAIASLALLLGSQSRVNRTRRHPWLVGFIALSGCLLLGLLSTGLPLLISSSLLILSGQGILYGLWGLWLSHGIWWLLSLTDDHNRGMAPPQGTS
ncbi:bifunctional NUDIX hydrolase/phosphatase PAP2 family protein [Aeromonas bivalvium]|uniref:bifunctional NUDIX hydrolase/phosphatase PAP2 family protein n=1 Tax=Aeromonas bivalvium TaxID=440079 RepID=UPI0038D18739